MGRLDQLDLSLKLSKEEESRAALEAIEDMVARTDHDPSPWQLVEAESKKYARMKVVETVIERIEDWMGEQQMEPPAFGT
jgi:polyphosphate kinase 2 (PPK2 family)